MVPSNLGEIRQRCRRYRQCHQQEEEQEDHPCAELEEDQTVQYSMGGIRCLWKRLCSLLDDIIDTCHWYIWRRWTCPLSKGALMRRDDEVNRHMVPATSLRQPLLSGEGRTIFDEWQDRVRAQYSHEKDGYLLKRLWNAAFVKDGAAQECNLPNSYRSDRWVDLGFQSDDPSRDFRGGGVLSLECLVYMAETSPDVFHRLMAKTHGMRSEYEYPFAASCISVVFSLLDALKIRTLSSTHIDVSPSSYGFAHLYQQHDDAFEKIVLHTMLYLDALWVSTSASYMDFPYIQKLVCAHAQRLVGKRWFNNPSMISNAG